MVTGPGCYNHSDPVGFERAYSNGALVRKTCSCLPCGWPHLHLPFPGMILASPQILHVSTVTNPAHAYECSSTRRQFYCLQQGTSKRNFCDGVALVVETCIPAPFPRSL